MAAAKVSAIAQMQTLKRSQSFDIIWSFIEGLSSGSLVGLLQYENS